MKLFKALFFFLLLGGDYGLELASLEASPHKFWDVMVKPTFCLLLPALFSCVVHASSVGLPYLP